MGRAATCAGCPVFTVRNRATVFLVTSEKAETRVFPDVRKPVSENIACFKFFDVIKQVARENSTVGHDRKLFDPSCTSHSRRQGIFVKAGGVDPTDPDIGI